MKNIVLIGFMGTGKTTIATTLARNLDLNYISTDDLIEKREKRTINEIFERSGEKYFREVESSLAHELGGVEDSVIDCGGGIVLKEENIVNLKLNGIVIALTAKPEVIYERTRKYKHRPLLNVDDPKLKIRELMVKRAPMYAKADYTIDTGELTINQVIEKITAIYKDKNKVKQDD